MSIFSAIFPTPSQNVRMAWRSWGAPITQASKPVIICVHALSHNSAVFEALGAALADRYLVLAPDMPGRGLSDNLENPYDYNLDFYARLMVQWLDYLGIEKFGWLGSSMGGLIGLHVGAFLPHAIQAMVLNDVGPFVPAAMTQFIAEYLSPKPVYTDRADRDARLAKSFAPFALETQAEFDFLADAFTVPLAGGGFTRNYDEKLVEPFRLNFTAHDWWPMWRRVTAPALLLRGLRGGLVLNSTLEEMQNIKPDLQLIEFEQIGHLPMLLNAAQINPVGAFFDKAMGGAHGNSA